MPQQPKSLPVFDYEPVAPARARRADSAEGFRRDTPADHPSDFPDEKFDDGGRGRGDSTSAAAARPAGALKPGHALTFAGLYLFTFVLYFRPYELIPFLSGFTSMALWAAVATLAVFLPVQLSLEGNLTARPREVNLILLLALAALLSIPLAVSRAEAWETFTGLYVKVVLIFIVIVNVLRTERRIVLLMCLGIAVGVYSSVGAFNDFRLGRVSEYTQRVVGPISRGMLGNPNDLALHLVTMLPLAAALLFSARGMLRKLAYAASAALLAVGTVVTFSRAGFLGLLSVLLVLAWKLGRRHRLAIMMAIVLFGAGFLLLLPSGYGSRLAAITDVSRDATGSAQARKELLLLSVAVAVKNPLFGLGMNNFHIVSIGEAVSHNAYTQVAAELGLPALALYVTFMLWPYRRLRQIERETFTRRGPPRFYYLAAGLQASLVGYAVCSFFASVAYQWYVYYLVAYAVGLRRVYEAGRAADEKTQAAGPSRAAAAAERVAAA